MGQANWRDCTDGTLVIAATVGELEAFDELVWRFRPAVLAVARRIVGAEAAEDVAQDALLLAFKALPQLDDPEKFGSWLYAITRHRAIRFTQNHAYREETGHSEVDLLILQHTPELSQHPAKQVEQEESQREVREALERLPEEFQIVLQLHYFEDVPVARIAEFLNLPLTTVKWRLYKGRQLMKEQLEDRWSITPTGRRRRKHERAREIREKEARGRGESENARGTSEGENEDARGEDENARGENENERGKSAHPAGGAPSGADADEHQQDRTARQPDGTTLRWEGGGNSSIQRRVDAAQRVGRRDRRSVLAAVGGGVV